MKRFIEGEDRSQVTLLPECLDDYIAEDNPVRVVEAFVSPPKFEPTAPQVETQLVPGHFNTEPPVFERVAPDLEPSIFPVFYVAAFHSLILPLSSPPLKRFRETN